MIELIEISPSGRACCKGCGNAIKEGTPRGVNERLKNNHIEKSYYCYKCLPEKIEDELLTAKTEFDVRVKRLNKLKIELGKSIKANAKKIVLAELK